MENILHINFVKYANLSEEGRETDVNYAVHIFNDWNELMLGHNTSFQDLKESNTVESLISLIKSLEDKNFINSIMSSRGLFFNKKWYSLHEIDHSYSSINNMNCRWSEELKYKAALQETVLEKLANNMY